jgi:hypothetical protein
MRKRDLKFDSTLSIILVLLSLFVLLAGLKIKWMAAVERSRTFKTLLEKRSAPLELNYVVIRTITHTGLSIYDAEPYPAAIVAQQLIGNLVYYSNFGRYEPRIARSWTRPDLKSWSFEIREGFVCENGEAITAGSFRKSLERSIRIQEKHGGALVFRQLDGFKEFIAGKGSLAGISAIENRLVFKFKTPIREGLLEALSYAPYGYLAAENFDADLTWKNQSKFVSSGPYKVTSVSIGEKITLQKRPDWNGDFVDNSPDTVNVTYKEPANAPASHPVIIDVTRRAPENIDSSLGVFKSVPEYMMAVVLGNLGSGFFASLENRRAFKERIEAERSTSIPQSLALWVRAESFYPNQLEQSPEDRKESNSKFRHKFGKTNGPIRIQGYRPPKNSNRIHMENLVTKVLDDAGLQYEFTETDDTMGAFSDKSADVRVVAQSIGGEVRPWTINVLFCSPLSVGYPDPSGRICELIRNYDVGKIESSTVTKNFLEFVEQDAAVFPMIHYGIHLYLSPSVDRSSFGPLFSVLKFDQLRIIL